MKRMQLNAALAAVALGLGVAVYVSQKKEEKGPPLTSLTSETITKVSLEHPNAAPIRLEKSGTAWRLVEPVQGEADDAEIGAILNLATLETKLTLDAAQVKPAELGLAPPQYTVTLNDQKLEVGGVEPLNYRRYVRAGGKIVLVDDPPSPALDADYSDLVAKTPIPAGAEIVGIQLPAFTIARAADGKSWTLDPEQPDATSDAKQKLVDGWKSARAMWMAADSGDAKGDEVVVAIKNRDDLRLVIVERDPQLVVVRPDLKVRYTLSKALADELLRLPVEPKEEPKAEPQAELKEGDAVAPPADAPPPAAPPAAEPSAPPQP